MDPVRRVITSCGLQGNTCEVEPSRTTIALAKGLLCMACGGLTSVQQSGVNRSRHARGTRDCQLLGRWPQHADAARSLELHRAGHSTFSGAAAEVLSYVFPSGSAEFERQKEEASIS